MASSGHPPKARKRVDVEEASGGLKRSTDGSAFTRCDICNKGIPVAIADMHDCGSDLKTKARLQSPKPAEEPPKKKSTDFGKKRERSSTDEQKSKKTSKPNQAKKDPKMPKRPLTSFLSFMEDFRKAKEENLSIKPTEMTKLGGERWKEMSDEDKAPYNQKAAQLKAEYEAQMKKYKGGDSKGEAKNEDGE